MNLIKRHTEDIHTQRIEARKIAGRNNAEVQQTPMKTRNQYGKEASHLTTTTAHSDMDSYIKTARMSGHNTNVGNGIWSLSSRTPKKPYLPILKDVYPRNEYTMMHQQRNAPRYYDGKFVTYDYKDMVQQTHTSDLNDGRPVVFKTQNIEKVQTKKKYGHNLKGQSSVPLHLCNDTSSELFQRSLNPDFPRDRSHLTSGSSRASEISRLRAIVDKYPDPQVTHLKNEISALNPLGYAATTQRWINSTYPTISRSSNQTDRSSSVYGVKDREVELDDSQLRSGRIKTEPEWYSKNFPRDKVASALKFMGESKALIHTGNKSVYDINFNGKV